MVGISERTASVRAAAGQLKRFEHGFPGCGNRKYSRTLVEREMQHRWAKAIKRQDNSLALADSPDEVAPPNTEPEKNKRDGQADADGVP